jgi:hypothetical protein
MKVEKLQKFVFNVGLCVDLKEGAACVSCEAGHCLMVTKVRERRAASKQGTHREVQSREINEVEDREQYRVRISNRFVHLEHLDTEVDIIRAWKTIRGNKIYRFVTMVY